MYTEPPTSHNVLITIAHAVHVLQNQPATE